jgi:N-acetylmuramoyl-L-alanine amidase
VLDDPHATRDTLVREAERLGALAVSENGTARGVLLATLAGELRARAFRIGGGTSEDDGRRALEWWTVAAGRADLPDVCRPARLRALFAGEIAHDPRVTYRELYVARRRFSTAPCVGELDEALDRVSTFKPSPMVLEGLDRALAAEGVGTLDAAIAEPEQKHAARIVRLSRWTTADSARVVIELDHAATYVLEPASTGTVRVRLEGVEIGNTDATIEPSKGLLTGGTLAAIDKKTEGTAVVLSLARPAYRRVFFLPDPFRVVIDLSTTPPTANVGSGPRPLRRVVVDAGHGGSDPGAIGPSGLREKDVTLAIAKSVAPLVAKDLGAEVRLTRGNDAFVSLEERAAAGNAFEADVFLSIHCNAAEQKNRRGVEMYVLDTARDEIATRVAARENGGASAAPGELRAILDDLKLAELGNRSHHLASLLQKATMSSLHGGSGADFGDVVDGGVHGAGFFVLVGARMPAVLMEVSFISNPVEEGYLGKAEYRSRIVDAIVNALRAYRDGK